MHPAVRNGTSALYYRRRQCQTLGLPRSDALPRMQGDQRRDDANGKICTNPSCSRGPRAETEKVPQALRGDCVRHRPHERSVSCDSEFVRRWCVDCKFLFSKHFWRLHRILRRVTLPGGTSIERRRRPTGATRQVPGPAQHRRAPAPTRCRGSPITSRRRHGRGPPRRERPHRRFPADRYGRPERRNRPPIRPLRKDPPPR